MIGELRVVDSVPDAFAAVVKSEMERVLGGPTAPEYFRLGCSGSSSGSRCFTRLAAEESLAWGSLALYFVDERCVPADSPDANQETLREALGPRLEQLAGFWPMSCEQGAASYAARLQSDGLCHLAQLGLGPDGHTASLFPDSAGLGVPSDQLVIENLDPSGLNVHPRLSLTFSALAQIPRLVMTVIGADKAEILARVDAGDDLPASRVDSPSVLWLCDAAAAANLPHSR
jgi:6-phosphogluconolactonase